MPYLALRGFAIGNGEMSEVDQINSAIDLMYFKGLIGKEYARSSVKPLFPSLSLYSYLSRALSHSISLILSLYFSFFFPSSSLSLPLFFSLFLFLCFPVCFSFTLSRILLSSVMSLLHKSELSGIACFSSYFLVFFFGTTKERGDISLLSHRRSTLTKLL